MNRAELTTLARAAALNAKVDSDAANSIVHEAIKRAALSPDLKTTLGLELKVNDNAAADIGCLVCVETLFGIKFCLVPPGIGC